MRGLSNQAVVKIAPELLDPIDKVVNSVKDEFGIKRFGSRKDVVDEAVRQFLRKTKEQEVKD